MSLNTIIKNNPLNTVVLEILCRADYGDITLIFSDGSKKKILSLILTTHSEYFSKMLIDSNFEESKTKTIEIKQFSKNCVLHMLGYMYYSQHPMITPDTLSNNEHVHLLFEFINLCDMYMLELLKKYILTKIIDSIDEKNANLVIKLCQSHDLFTDIYKRCVFMLAIKYKNCINGEKKVICYDDIKPGSHGKSPTHDFQFCCDHYKLDKGYTNKASQYTVIGKNYICLVDYIAGRMTPVGKYETKYCCRHRSKPLYIHEKTKEAHDTFLECMALPEEIKNDIMSEMFHTTLPSTYVTKPNDVSEMEVDISQSYSCSGLYVSSRLSYDGDEGNRF